MVQATPASVGLPKNSIDVAFFCDAYHHIDAPAPYLASLFAAVVPGGKLVIIDYDLDRLPKDKGFLRSHIRADSGQFRAEIEQAGFKFVKAHELLEENFFFVFERP